MEGKRVVISKYLYGGKFSFETSSAQINVRIRRRKTCSRKDSPKFSDPQD